LGVEKLRNIYAGGDTCDGESDMGSAITFIVARLQTCFIERVSMLSKDAKRLSIQLDAFADYWTSVEAAMPKLDHTQVKNQETAVAAKHLKSQVGAAALMARAVRLTNPEEVWPSKMREATVVLISITTRTQFSKAFSSYPGAKLFMEKVRVAGVKNLVDEKFHTAVAEVEAKVLSQPNNNLTDQSFSALPKIGREIFVKLGDLMKCTSKQVYEDVEAQLVFFSKWCQNLSVEMHVFITKYMATHLGEAAVSLDQHFKTCAQEKLLAVKDNILPIVRTLQGMQTHWARNTMTFHPSFHFEMHLSHLSWRVHLFDTVWPLGNALVSSSLGNDDLGSGRSTQITKPCTSQLIKFTLH
jgi:hypothetical protein